MNMKYLYPESQYHGSLGTSRSIKCDQMSCRQIYVDLGHVYRNSTKIGHKNFLGQILGWSYDRLRTCPSTHIMGEAILGVSKQGSPNRCPKYWRKRK